MKDARVHVRVRRPWLRLGGVVGVTCLLAGCGGDARDKGEAPDSGAPAPAACVVSDAFGDLTAALTEVPTVVRVSWAGTPPPGAVRIRFDDGVRARFTPVVEGDRQDALLIGLGALRTVSWTIESDDGVTRRCSPTQTVQTGALDPRLPERVVSGVDPSGNWAATSILTQSDAFAVVLDEGGRVVWARHMGEDPPRGPFRVALARSGDALLTGTTSFEVSDQAVVERIGWDGVVQSEVRVRGGHTDFVELPDGSIAMLGWDLRPFSGERFLLGDTLVIVQPDGTARSIWSSYDAVTPDLSRRYDSGFYRADPRVEDWSHANGISFADAEGAFYVTMRGLNVLARIDADGSTDWTAGGPGAGIPTDLLDNPHSVELQEDGSYLVFNAMKEACSSVQRLRVDPTARQVTSEGVYQGTECLNVYLFGDARVETGGHVRVAWSSAGRIETFDAAGTSLQRIDLGVGSIFGFIDTFPPPTPAADDD